MKDNKLKKMNYMKTLTSSSHSFKKFCYAFYGAFFQPV